MHVQRFHRVQAANAENVGQSSSARELDDKSRRLRLTELDSYIHISVIGTCLARADLRDIVARFAGLDLGQVSDFELHHAAVQIAAEGGHGAQALNESLDSRYEQEIRRFERARDENELLQWWRAGRHSGETAGAYWALMTHPRTTCQLRQRIVGELHGLIYLATAPSPNA
jgi:hypothetical protein